MSQIEQLRLVEIELFSFCNRKCNWCPNSYIDRKSTIEYLDKNILFSLLHELKQNNFSGRISFSRYNEPFAEHVFLRSSIEFIKTILPDTIMVSNTNGDYINEDVLKTMLIDELTIMDYDNKGKDAALEKLRNWNVQDIQEFDHYFVGSYNEKKILYYYSWREIANISDRGGNLKDYSIQKREVPCYEPLYFIGINYDGTVSPCCNVRNDCENQKKYILGDLKEKTLSDILQSNVYLDFVKQVTSAEFSYGMPCYYCNNSGGRYTREKGGILY